MEQVKETETNMEQLVMKINELQRSIDALLNNQVSDVMNIDQCLQMTGFSRALLYKMTSNKEIPHYKKGRFLFFNRSEIEAWLLEDRVKTQEELEQESEMFMRRIRRHN